MNHEIEPSLLISFVVLITLIGFVVWWYGIRKGKSTSEVLFKAPGYKDKLTLINGIGPTLEAKLNKLGIESFKQIAELTDADLQRINVVLDFKGRIEREGWMAQAEKLVKAGSRPPTPPRGGMKKVVMATKRQVQEAARKQTATKKKTAKKSTKKT